MKIFISDSKGQTVPIFVNETDTVKELKNKIIKTKNIQHDNHYHNRIEICYNGMTLEDNDTISESGLEDGSHVIYFLAFIAGGGIDKLKIESNMQIPKKIGFDMNLL